MRRQSSRWDATRWCWRPAERRAAARETQRETTQAGLDAAPRGADHCFEVGTCERQYAAAGNRAAQHRAGHRASFARRGGDVEARQLPAVGSGDLQQAFAVEAAVAGRQLLEGGQGAPRRRQQRGAPGRDEAVLDRAHCFEQLGGHHQVHAARHRRQAQHGGAAAEFGVSLEMDFDVVGGRAGTLRHAGNRGGLRRMAGARGDLDQPFGQHAAAFAAQRGDQYRDRLLLSHAGCTRRMTPRRRAASARSARPGFCTTSTR